MAITVASNVITITDKHTGTATSGAATTLTNTGASFGATDGLVNYIVYITGGTGAGQSRYITANTSTVLTVDQAWTTNPASGSTYKVAHNAADLVAAGVGASWATNAADLDVNIAATITNIDVTGSFGQMYASFNFLNDRCIFTSSSTSSFMQLGYLQPDGSGMGGGAVIARLSKPADTYYAVAFLGVLRLYGTRWILKKDPLFNDREFTYNYTSTAASQDIRNSVFDGFVFGTTTGETCDNNQFTQRSLFVLKGTTASFNSNVFQSTGFAMGSSTMNGVNVRNLKFIGDTSTGFITHEKPLFCNSSVFTSANGSKVYFIDPVFQGGAITFADAMTWYNAAAVFTSNQRIYEARELDIETKTSALADLGTVNIRLIDASGNAAWTTGKNATTFVPTKASFISTDANGDYADVLVVTQDQYCNDNQTAITGNRTAFKVTTTYRPFTMTARKYAYQAQNLLPRDWAASGTETLVFNANPFTSANYATASGYTGISINGGTSTITVSGTRTVQELYDYTQYWAAETANLEYTEPLITSDGTIFSLNTGWSISVTGSLSSTTKEISGTLTVASGGYFEDRLGARWDVSGTTYYASAITHTVSGSIAGVEVAYIDSGLNNRTYNTSRAAVTSLTSDGSGVVSGYAVYKVGGTTYSGHTIKARQYGYQLYEVPQTVTGTAISSSIILTADSFAATAEGTVAAYTGIAINYGAKTVTVTATHTLTKLYEYLMYSVTLQANILQSQPLATTNGTSYTFATDWDLIVSATTVAEVAKSFAYQGTGALTCSSAGRYEDSTGLTFESGGSIYYGKHVYRNVKAITGGANQQYAIVACFDTDNNIDVTYNTSLTNGGLTTDASGNVEGYYIYKKDATTYTLTEYIGLYGFSWSTIPIAATGSAVGSSGTYDTIRLVTDSNVTLSRAAALALTGITANHSTAVIDGNAYTYSEIQDNLKARQTSSDDIEAGKKGYISYYQEGWLKAFDGSFYTLSSGWIIEDTTFGGTLKDSILRLATPGTYNLLLNSAQVNFEGAGTYDLRGSTITTDITVDTITDATVTVQVAPGTSVTNNDPTNITVESSTAVTITVNGIIAGSRIQIYDTDNTTELFNEIVAGTSFSDNFTYTADTDIRIRLMLVGASTARKWWTTTGTITAAGFSTTAAQEVNSVYATNGVDGSTVTECAINANNIDIQIDDPTNETTAQRIYNWYQYWLFTEAGIRDGDTLITATDSTHYVFDDSVQIKNMDTVNPLNILGANIVPTTGAATNIFDLSNGASIALNFTRVEGFAYSSGSGLSVGQAAQLDAIEAKTGNIVDGKAVATKLDVWIGKQA